MAANVTQGRYPKRSRAAVNYNVEKLSTDNDIDLGDGDAGEDSIAADGTSGTTVVAAAKQSGADANGDSDSSLSSIESANSLEELEALEALSELEDATYGSRKTKKQRLLAKKKAKSRSVVKRPHKVIPFRFMDLPGELRMKVYEEALVDPHGVNITTFSNRFENIAVHVHPTRNSSMRYARFGCYVRGQWTHVFSADFPDKKYQLSPNILAASTTIHQEAVSLLWKQPFIFNSIDGLHAFLLTLRPETIARLRDITLLTRGWDTNTRAFQAFVLLRDAPLLQNLRIDCRISPDNRTWHHKHASDVESGNRLAARFYRGSHPFLKELIKHQGFDSILKVFKFTRDEFNTRHFDAATNGWVFTRWSEARESRILDAMIAELKVIMDTKIVVPYLSQRRR